MTAGSGASWGFRDALSGADGMADPPPPPLTDQFFADPTLVVRSRRVPAVPIAPVQPVPAGPSPIVPTAAAAQGRRSPGRRGARPAAAQPGMPVAAAPAAALSRNPAFDYLHSTPAVPPTVIPTAHAPVASKPYVVPSSRMPPASRPPAIYPGRSAPAGAPKAVAPAPQRARQPAQQRRSSGVIGLLFFVIVFLFATGVGEKIINAINELLRRR